MLLKHFTPGTLLLALAAAPSVHAVTGESILSNGFDGGLLCTEAPSGSVEVNVRSVLIQPEFLLNGEPFAANALQSATFHLVPTEGEPILLGTSFDPPASGVRVVAGVYDLEYRWRSGDEVPRNAAARIIQGIDLTIDRALVVDVPGITVRGPLGMNGSPFPNAGADAANLSLVGVYGLGNVGLGSSDNDTYQVQIIPGAYRLRYQSPGTAATLPRNRDALLGRRDFDADTDPVALDVASVDADFIFRIDGVDAPNVATENGQISLRTTEGDLVELGQSRFQFVTRRFIPGRYDAYWRGLAGAAIAPANEDSRFDVDRQYGNGIHVLDVPTVVTSGSFLVGGAPAPVSPLENGLVYLVDPGTGGNTLLGQTRDSTYSVRAIPGIYALRYEYLTGSALMPSNGSNVFAFARDLVAQPVADINVPVVALDFQLTLNGGAFPGSALERGRIRTRSASDAADILLGDTDEFGGTGGTRRLLPGSYPALYSRMAGGALVPANTRSRIAGSYLAQENGGGLQSLNVITGAYSFAFRDNGLPFANTASRVAAFELRHFEDVVPIGRTDNDAGQQLLVSNAEPLADGRNATAYYSWQTGPEHLIAQNIGTPVACYALRPDPTTIEQ